MSGSGSPERKAAGAGVRIAVVAATWHDDVMDGLIAGARRAAAEAQAEVTVFRVPGSFELPVACRRAADHFDAVVALGVIIRGGTPHFEYVAGGVTLGLTEASVQTGVPIGFGVLTCDTDEQARDRAGLPGSSEDKGGEAVDAVLGTLAALSQISSSGTRYVGFTGGPQ